MNISLKRYYEILSKYLAAQRWQFGLLCSLVLATIGLQIVNPQIMRYFLDAASTGKSDRLLTMAALTFLAAALLNQALSVCAAYMGESVAWTATNALREDLATHCLSLDMSFHRDKSPGELIERIEGDVSEFAAFFSQLVIRVLGNLVLLAGILVALCFVEWRLAAAFGAFTVFALLALYQVRGVAIPHQKAQRDAETDLFGFLEEKLAGTEDIRSCGAVDYCIRRLYELQAIIMKRWLKASMTQLIIASTMGLTMMAGISMALWAGLALHRAGLITVGTAYLVINYMNLLSRPIRELTRQAESLQKIGATVERMGELLSLKPTIEDGPGATIPDSVALALSFDDVAFQYSEGKPVLKDVSFELAPGKVLGLLGRTGTGKTTLARLIFRLYDPQGGSIRLGGVGLRDAKLARVRQRVAYVTQDVQLFQATVRDNITFFDKTIPDEKTLEVIDALGLRTWFDGLAQGLDTKIETGGRSLSAGEAQLLALTRVFLRNPSLVILDEASSRLDPATEQLVEGAIDKLLHGRTAIIIAHRLGTLHRADEIMILEEGQVAEHGQRLDLLSNPASRFYSLHQTGMEDLLA